MAILIAGGAFFGAILGRIFKVFVLIPAVALAIASILVRREVAGHTWLDTFLGVGLLITSLELGYVTGLISTDICAVAQVFAEFWRARAAGHRRAQPTKDNRLCLGRCFAPGTFVERHSPSRARCGSAIRFDGRGSSGKIFCFP